MTLVSINEIGRDFQFTEKALLKTYLEFQPEHDTDERGEGKNIHGPNEKGVESRNI